MFPLRFQAAATFLSSLALSQQNRRTSRKFGFNAGTHFRNEFRGEDGFIEGEYGFRTPDGCMHVVRYEASKNQYRVTGTSKRDCNKPRPKTLAPKPKVSLPEIIERMKEFVPAEPAPLLAAPNEQPAVPLNEPSTTTTTTTRAPSSTTTTQPPAIITTTTRKPKIVTKKPRVALPTKPKPKAPKKERLVVSPINNEIKGKQIFDTTDPPPNMDRPRILAPDDPDPVYSFGFEAPGHGHTQAGLPDGTKKGEYFFDSPDGWRRFVSYEATKDGFFPKMRRERIPGWETSPLNPKNRFRAEKERKQGRNDRGGEGEGEGAGQDGEGGQAGDEKNGKGGPGAPNEDEGIGGKQLVPLLEPSNGCPYYFYTNTKINFHWERCLENGTRVGEYGRLADDGFSHRVAYYADARGFHPKITKTPLTREQEDTVAGFTQGAFIIPKIDEEKKETERRIQEWIAQNRDRIDSPL